MTFIHGFNSFFISLNLTAITECSYEGKFNNSLDGLYTFGIKLRLFPYFISYKQLKFAIQIILFGEKYLKEEYDCICFRVIL